MQDKVSLIFSSDTGNYVSTVSFIWQKRANTMFEITGKCFRFSPNCDIDPLDPKN